MDEPAADPERFQVRAVGIAARADEAETVQALSARFKLAPAQARKIAAGGPLVSRDLTGERARQLKARLFEIGLLCRVERAGQPPPEAAVPAPQDQAAIERFIADLDRHTSGVRRSALYRVWSLVVVLSAVVSPLLYLLLIVATGVGTYVYVDLAPTPRSFVTALLYVTPLLVLGVTGVFLLRPLFTRYAEPVRIEVDAATAPGLHALARRISAATGTPEPALICIDNQVNASVSPAGGLLDLFRGRLTLTVGLPLVYGLTLPQFASVVAHEFGHFTQRFEMFASAIVNRVNAWMARCAHDDGNDPLERWLRTWEANLPWADLPFTVARWCMHLVRLVMRGLLNLNVRLTRSLSREMEFNADDHAVQLVGSQAFVDSSYRLRELICAEQEAWSLNFAAFDENQLLRNVPEAVIRVHSGYTAEIRDQIRAGIEQDTSEYWHTHPADRDRIARAETQGVPTPADTEVPARALLRDPDALAAQVTLRTYGHEYGIASAADYLVSNDQIFALRQDRDAAQAALELLFGDIDRFRALELDEDPTAMAADAQSPGGRVKLQSIERLAARRQQALQSLEPLEELADKWCLAAAYRDAGVKLRDGDLGITRIDPATLDAELAQATERATAAAAELADCDAAYLKLLRWVQHTLDGEAGQRYSRLLDWMLRYAGQRSTEHTLVRLRNATLALMAERDAAPDSIETSIERCKREAMALFQRLLDNLGGLPNPLPTAAPGETVEAFLASWDVERLPDPDRCVAERAVEVVDNAVRGLRFLHYRVMGELAVTAAARVEQRSAAGEAAA